jgi:hypothetical protein
MTLGVNMETKSQTGMHQLPDHNECDFSGYDPHVEQYLVEPVTYLAYLL